jgi:hypothetical protein
MSDSVCTEPQGGDNGNRSKVVGGTASKSVVEPLKANSGHWGIDLLCKYVGYLCSSYAVTNTAFLGGKFPVI